MIRTTAVAALAAALLVAPAAARDRAAPPNAQRVTHSDLDLGDARDVARLDRRLLRAAREVCGASSTQDLVGRREDRRCAAAALARTTPARTAAITAATQVRVAER